MQLDTLSILYVKSRIRNMELSPQPMVKLGVVHLLMKEKHKSFPHITYYEVSPITKVDHFLWGIPKQCLLSEHMR